MNVLFNMEKQKPRTCLGTHSPFLASAAPISATLFEGFLPFYHEAHLIAQHIAETEFPWCVDPFDSSKALGNDTFLSPSAR